MKLMWRRPSRFYKFSAVPVSCAVGIAVS